MSKLIVTGLPGEPGAIFESHELIAAFRASADAKAFGLEGRLYVVDPADDQVQEINPATRVKGAKLAKAPWTP